MTGNKARTPIGDGRELQAWVKGIPPDPWQPSTRQDRPVHRRPHATRRPRAKKSIGNLRPRPDATDAGGPRPIETFRIAKKCTGVSQILNPARAEPTPIASTKSRAEVLPDWPQAVNV